MFHTPRAPYTTCTYFTNFTYNQYIRPCILLHAVPTFLPIPPPQVLRDTITSCYCSLFIQQRLNMIQFRTQTAYPKLTFQVKCHSTLCSP